MLTKTLALPLQIERREQLAQRHGDPRYDFPAIQHLVLVEACELVGSCILGDGTGLRVDQPHQPYASRELFAAFMGIEHVPHRVPRGVGVLYQA